MNKLFLKKGGNKMPIISQFYGIVIQMFFDENGKHHEKHIHIKYNEYEADYNIEGKLLEGILPKKQKKLVEAWIYIHQEELESLWNLMQEQGEFFKIEPLK